MVKFSAALAFALLGIALAVPEDVEHGSHGAEKHKTLHFKGGKHNAAYDLEALLASAYNEELAELSEDVRRNRLRVLAQSHDTNKNGEIEPEELMDWVLHSFKILDKQEADQACKEEDEDEDGKVSFDELLKKRYGYTPEDFEEMKKKLTTDETLDDEKETFDMVEEDRKRFNAADVNQDGFLDKDEFVAFHQPYDYPHMHSIEMEKALKDHDDNKDGFIQMSEFVKASPEDEEERQSEMTNFDNMDKDKDGKLTVEEFKSWVLLDNKDLAKDEVDHLLKDCDENEDGRLTIDEIVEKEEEFLSSQATDYGRHLHFVKDEL